MASAEGPVARGAPHGGAAALARGAAYGAAAALVFGACEAVGIAAGRLWGASAADPIAPDPVGMLWLLLGAALAGALLGAAAGAAARWRSRSAPGVAEGALAAVVLAAAARWIAAASPGVAIAGLLIGCAGVAACAVVAGRAAAARFVATPWTAAPLLVGLAALGFDLLRRAAPPALVVALLAWSAAVLLVARLLWRPARATPRPGRALGAAGLAALAATALVAAPSGPPRAALPPPRAAGERLPDIVLVTLDTVRSDHLSVYGYGRDTTPQLETFARRATVYTRAIAASDLTLSTHASLFTGLYTHQHGARVDAALGAAGLAESARTLAEALRDAGYLTLAVVGNPTYLAARWGFDQGFLHYDDRPPAPPLPALRPHHLLGAVAVAARALGAGGEGFERAETAYRRAGEVNRAVFALLEQVAERPEPLFLFVNYMDPHWPYDPPPPWDARYPGRLRAGAPTLSDFRAARLQVRPYTERQRAHLVSQYDGEIAYADAQLGHLLERLRALGRFDGALVAITADHGEAFGEHGLASHGVALYQHQVHVPFLLKRPGQRTGERSDALVSSVDLVPTALEAAGLPVPPGLAGVSLLRGAPPADRAVASESYPDSALVAAHPRFRRTLRAVVRGDWKLIASSRGDRELYDLARDPGERVNRYGSAGAPDDLERAVEDWPRGEPALRGRALPLDAATRERLRALGYAP